MSNKEKGVRHPNALAKTETSSLKSLNIEGIEFRDRRIDKGKFAKGIDIELIKEDWNATRTRTAITLTQKDKTLVTFRGAFPYLADALCELCTLYPERVMYKEDDTNPYYRIDIDRDELLYYATNNERCVKGYFLEEVSRLITKPRPWAINYGNGRGDIVHVFHIVPHFEESTRYKNLPSVNSEITSFTIFFYRWLFKAALEGEAGGKGGGFIITAHAFHSMSVKTLEELEAGTTEEGKAFLRLANPKKITAKKEEYKTVFHATLHKFIIWFLVHAEPKANLAYDHVVRKNSEEVIDMLRQVSPRLLRTVNGEDFIRDKIDAQILIDKACLVFNKCARNGYCEHMKAIPIKGFYKQGKRKSDFAFEIEFATNTGKGETKTMRGIPPYTSNLQNELFRQNPDMPLREGAFELDFE